MTTTNQPKTNGNYRKGFASMTLEKRKLIASNGGQKRRQLAIEGKAPSYSEIGKKGGSRSRMNTLKQI